MSDPLEDGSPLKMEASSSQSSSKPQKIINPLIPFKPTFVNRDNLEKLRDNPYLLISQMNDVKICCNLCEIVLDSSTFFQHAMDKHSVFSCLCCLQSFSFCKELLVHLYRIHKTRSQEFHSVESFLKEFGRQNYITCQECGLTFDTSKDMSTITNHVCKPSGTCPRCKGKFVLTLLGLHLAKCKALLVPEPRKRASISGSIDSSVSNLVVPSQMTFPPTTSGFISQLRSRTNCCKTCGLMLLQKDMAAHKKDCQERSLGSGSGSWLTAVKRPHSSGLPPLSIAPASSSPFSSRKLGRAGDSPEIESVSSKKQRINAGLLQQARVILPKLKPAPKGTLGRYSTGSSKSSLSPDKCDVTVTRISINKSGAHPVVRTCDNISIDEMESVNKNEMLDIYSSSYEEEEVSDEEVKLDPLLLEEDPNKRLKMLIQELNDNIKKTYYDIPHGFTLIEPNSLELIVDFKLSDASDEKILCEMLKVSQSGCVYCRQAKLIKVDKRQLSIHLLSRHKWTLNFSPIPVKKTEPDMTRLYSYDALDGYSGEIIRDVKETVFKCVKTVSEVLESSCLLDQELDEKHDAGKLDSLP